jgi:hypothetical protein
MNSALVVTKAKLYTGGLLSFFSVILFSSVALQNNKSFIQIVAIIGFIATIEASKLILYTDAKNPLKSIQNTKVEAEVGKEISNAPTPSYEIPMSIEEAKFFQEMSKSASFPLLEGRDKVALRLGKTCGEAKKIVSSLQQKGKIRVKGKRLVAC